jgi:hypothetical protein
MEGVLPPAPNPLPVPGDDSKRTSAPTIAAAPTGGATPAGVPTVLLSDADRAALQAQLHLFAAQVAAFEGLGDEDPDAEGEDDPDITSALREEEEEEEEEDGILTLGAVWAGQAWRAHGYSGLADVAMDAPPAPMREEEEEEEEEEDGEGEGEMQLVTDVVGMVAG